MADETSPAVNNSETESLYMNPQRVCDLVMKGGITSGIVYPPAIDEIAQKFWLSGIGGTSAGAIAAALAAAAELSRRNGDQRGYLKLRGLPSEISAKGRMLMLFKPDASTKRAFRLLIRSLELKQHDANFSGLRLGARAAWLFATQRPVKRLVENGLGLCTGMALGQARVPGELPPLTEWLSHKIDEMAGKEKGVSPLTFGDLWDAPAPPGDLGAAMGKTSGIYLQLVSTCLTFGRPYALPYLDNRFAFSIDEFRRLFPEYVVEYLVREGKKIIAQTKVTPPNGLLPLPIRAKLPVIVAVRMSLSFPVLFSTVPLHYIDFRETPPIHEEVRFADGGITSNLPVYFFDSPFPRWPTLAINLQYTTKAGDFGRSNVSKNHVWKADSTTDGTLELFHRFLSSSTNTGKLLGLAGAIFRSSQVWSDNSFLKLPGYRDRVVEIWLDPHEGGMNLNMDEKVIRDLVRYGGAAGADLVHRFAVAPATDPLSWQGHFWCRYRAQMASLMHYLRKWEEAIAAPIPSQGPALAHLLSGVSVPPCHPFQSKAQLANAIKVTDELRLLAAGLNAYPLTGKPHQASFRPFDAGPESSLSLQGRSSMVPHNLP